MAYLRLIEPQLADTGLGSTFGAINRDRLEGICVPLPPLPEQRRIAAALREQMAAVEKARAAAEAELAAIEALPAALLRRAFGGGA